MLYPDVKERSQTTASGARSELSGFEATARETLEDIFARVDQTLSRAHTSSTALGKGGEAHDALIAELTAALDEVRF